MIATPLLWGGNVWLLANLKPSVFHLFHVAMQMVTSFPSLARVNSGDFHLTSAKNLFLEIFWAQSLVK